MMHRCIAVMLFLVSSFSLATSSHNGWNRRPALVSRTVPRGGGLFNSNNNNKNEEDASKSVRYVLLFMKVVTDGVMFAGAVTIFLLSFVSSFSLSHTHSLNSFIHSLTTATMQEVE